MTRQAFQQMWQAWNHRTADQCSGFLLGSEACVTQVAMLAHGQTLAEMLAIWQAQSLSVLGCVQALTLQPTQVDAWQQTLAAAHADASFVLCMVLNTDTKGCLKTPAYVRHDGRMQEVSVLLLDDGQQPVKS